MALTGDKLLDKLTTLETTYFSAYHKQVLENRKMYDCQWTDLARLVNGDEFMVYIPPTAARSIDDPADHVLTMPKTRIPVRANESDSLKAQAQAEKKRKFIEAWWSRVVEDFDPIGGTIVDALNEGRFVWRRSFDFDALPDKPPTGAPRNVRRRYRKAMSELGQGEFLWNIECMDNLTVMEDPRSHRDPGYVYLKYRVTAEEAAELYPEASGKWKELDDYSEVTYTEYWTKPMEGEPGKCVRWIEDEVVWDDENPYDYIPVVIEDTGFGSVRHGAKPFEKYRGMTEKLFSTFVAEARQMTGWEINDELSVFPMLKAWNMDRTRKLTVGPGVITDLSGAKGDPSAEDIEYLQMPPVPVGVLHLVQKTTQIANSLTKMDTLSGQPVPGVETATEASQQINNASAKLGRVIAAYKRACARMNRMTFMDVEHGAEGPITIYGTSGNYGEVTLEPADIDGFYENTVELRTTDMDTVSQIKARFWGEMYRLIPFLSAWTAMERGEIADDPMAEMIRRSAEDVFLSPEMTSIRTLTGANSFGEFATLVKANGWGPQDSQAPPGPDSAQGLVSQDTMASPLQAQTVDTAYQNRDITQRLSQLRAPKDLKRAIGG